MYLMVRNVTIVLEIVGYQQLFIDNEFSIEYCAKLLITKVKLRFFGNSLRFIEFVLKNNKFKKYHFCKIMRFCVIKLLYFKYIVLCLVIL
jgi:hypothetical protein